MPSLSNGVQTGLACWEERSDGGGLGSSPSSESREEAEHVLPLHQPTRLLPAQAPHLAQPVPTRSSQPVLRSP